MNTIMKNNLSIILTIFLLLVSSPMVVFSQNPREYDPIILKGSDLANYQNFYIFSIYAFSYNKITDAWRQVPLQIDERDDSGEYLKFKGLSEFQLTPNDELVFMHKDAGDQASSSQWILDETSKKYQRYEISLSESSGSEQKKFLYLYVTENQLDTLKTDYIDQWKHVILSSFYTLGVDTSCGFINHLNFPEQKGRWGDDLIDRQKFRYKGEVNFLNYKFSYSINEERLRASKYLYIDGPVRVIRKMDIIARLYSTGYAMDIPLTTLLSKFYLASAEISCNPSELKSEYGMSLYRQSIDLNKGIDGMYFYNQANNAILIDGQTNFNIIKNFSNERPWILMTGKHGTILQVMDAQSTSEISHRLYYSEHGTKIDDGTEDSGIDGSWGDIGVLYEGKLVGNFKIQPRIMLLPFPVSKSWAQQQVQQIDLPPTANISSQSYVKPKGTITLIKPEDSSELELNTSQNIVWTSSDFSGNVKIELSRDLGLNWLPLASSIANSNQYLWTISGPKSDKCLIRISSINDPTIFSQNLQPFSIIEPLKADFYASPIQGIIPLEVQFTNTSSGDILNYYWDFGDGNSSREKNPIHTYRTEGKFTVNLFVSSKTILRINTKENYINCLKEIFVQIPDTLVNQGTFIELPVNVSAIFPENSIISYEFLLEYPSNLLTPKGLVVDRTMTSGWGLPFMTLKGTNLLKIGAIGPFSSLTGQGNLIKLKFQVIGLSGNEGTIKFNSFIFNNGNPPSKTKNALIKIKSTILEKSIRDEENSPKDFYLSQGFPNPFNQSVQLNFELPISANVKVTILDLMGKEIRIYNFSSSEMGRHTLNWDGSDSENKSVPSGTYFIRFEADKFHSVRKVILLR